MWKVFTRRGRYSRRSAAIALGQIVPRLEAAGQRSAVARIARLLRSEKDRSTRNFALISLGRIGGRSGVDPDVRNACVRMLLDAFKNGSPVMERPFAALGLGLIGLRTRDGGRKPAALRYRLAKIILDDLRPLKGDKVALGAHALALGMLEDRRPETVKTLIGLLEDRGLERKLRGKAALALGLIGDPAARASIRRTLREREDRALRVDTAVAAGLLGDSDAVPLLVGVLNDRKASQFTLGSVVLALGQIGNEHAVRALLEILEPGRKDGTFPDLTRALATIAIGQITDRRAIRVLHRISRDVNYRALVPALEEVLTIL